MTKVLFGDYILFHTRLNLIERIRRKDLFMRKKYSLLSFFGVISLLVVVCASWVSMNYKAPLHAHAATNTFSPGTYTETFNSGGFMRSYDLHVPNSYSSRSGPVPIVFLYHATGGSSSQIASLTRFTEKSDSAGFILVTPQGLVGAKNHATGWNAYDSFWGSINSGPDDVQFSKDILNYLSSNLDIDSKRVYATGFSAGAFLSYRLGQVAADKVAAIGPVAGNMQTDQYGIVPATAVSVIAIHDVHDTIALYNGGSSAGGDSLIADGPGRGDLVKTIMNWWAWRDGCSFSPAVSSVGIGPTTTKYDYPNCPTGIDISFYASNVPAGGNPHTWPGATDSDITKNNDGSATEAIWDFFASHPKP